MSRVETQSGTAAPLRRGNVDTDQIAPARFVPYFRPTGFTNILFADWRDDPEFVLNQPDYQGATILIAGRDFGTGSSRESAVWALQRAGFSAVIASRFGDIFHGNAVTRGLWPVEVDQRVVEDLWEQVEADPWLEISLDLRRRLLRYGDTEHAWRLEDSALQRLLSDEDAIAATLRWEDNIRAHERSQCGRSPVTIKATPS